MLNAIIWLIIVISNPVAYLSKVFEGTQYRGAAGILRRGMKLKNPIFAKER